jgi:UDP-N-acetylmuramoyl-tripeptide--D-alanyl-D-alanine ligase
MRWTLEDVAQALGVALPTGLDAVARVAGVSIDSREVHPGELFLAIRGSRHDGHDFVESVLASGVAAAVVARDRWSSYPAEIRPRLFAVDDTLRALQHLGATVLRKWRTAAPGRLVGAVAGSVGKTTTKEILAALLGSRFSVLKSRGNLNNEYGLPLTLFQLEDSHGAVVVELGMSRRGELARLTQIAAPDVGVITRIAVEHLEFFESVDEIALAERELIENLPHPVGGPDAPAKPSGIAVLNADDERVARFADVAPGKIIWFGTSVKADFRAENVEDRGIAGTAFDFKSPEGRARLELPLIGRHNVMNALAALAAARVWGIGAAEAKKVFPSLQPADKRGEVVRFADGFTVINDSYNSSPTALDALSDLLASSAGFRRRILAAGEMLELGSSARELHRGCGRHAAATRGIDWIIGVQGDAAEIVNAAIAAGLPKDRTRFFVSSTEAAKFLVDFITPGDLLLLKGSRGVKMETILEAIRARHGVADSLATKPAEPARTGRD